MAYSKLHSSLVNSSLWTEPDNVRILFITLLALCDRQGYVYGSKPGLERLANILVEEDDGDPWYTLMSPDVNSSDRMRNPENEGRRIEEVSGGFRLLNFEYYRGLRNDDDRREQNREAQARFKDKARVSQGKPRSAKVSQRKQTSSVSVSVSASVCTQKEVEDFCETLGLPRSDGEAMFLHWQEKGPAKVKDWKATIRKWKSFGYLPSQKNVGRNGTSGKPATAFEIKTRLDAVKAEKEKIRGDSRNYKIDSGQKLFNENSATRLKELSAKQRELESNLTT